MFSDCGDGLDRLDDAGEGIDDCIAGVEFGLIEFATEYWRAGTGAQAMLWLLIGGLGRE